MLNNIMNRKMTMVGIALIVIGIILVITDGAALAMNPKKVFGLIMFAAMIMRFVKTEYCEKRAA